MNRGFIVALSTSVAIALLAGCGGSPSPIGAPGMMAQPATTHTRAHRATSGDLIYATGACNGTCVLSYPAGTLVQTLNVGYGGICADNAGNVYIGEGKSLYEFAHGGTTPIHTFAVSDGEVDTCSIDPGTGNVALAVGQSNKFNVAIFSSPSVPPTTYLVNFALDYCGYDNAGNLFVDGSIGDYPVNFALFELAKNGAHFTNISVTPNLPLPAGQVQWDGSHVSVESTGSKKGVTLYQLDISGSNATIAGKTEFGRVTGAAAQSWIEGNLILIPFGRHGNMGKKTKVGIWNYPAGGKVVKKIEHFAKRPSLEAVTFSPGS